MSFSEVFTSFTGEATNLEALHVEHCNEEIHEGHLIRLVKSHPGLRDFTLQGATSITDKGLNKVLLLCKILGGCRSLGTAAATGK